jgi:hypothetical protein
MRHHKDRAVNSDINGKLSSLYEGFMGLAAEKQEAVVEAAQNLLEVQREIEALMKNTGVKTLKSGKTAKRRIVTGGSRRGAIKPADCPGLIANPPAFRLYLKAK